MPTKDTRQVEQALTHNRTHAAAQALLGLKTPAPKKEAGVFNPSPARSPLSSEQEQFLSLDGHRLVLTALAGCGKSRVLAEYASRNSHKKWAYLAFNKRMAQDALDTMPGVSCKTIHALAFASFGGPYRETVGAFASPSSIAKCAWQDKVVDEIKLANLLMGTVERFIASADQEISTSHIPSAFWRDAMQDHEGDAPRVVESAYRLWEAMVNTHHAMPMSLDGLVKLMQLAHFNPFPAKSAALLVDEAQDLTACIRSWLDDLPQASLRAGDPFQSIYGWRMHGFHRPWIMPGETAGWLCGSWRFGPEIASLVSPILAGLGSERSMEGLSGPTSIHSDPLMEGALLARTRKGLVLAAAEAAERGALLNFTDAPWLLDALQGRASTLLDDGIEEAAWRDVADHHQKTLLSRLAPQGQGLRLLTAHASKGATFEKVQLASDFSWPPTPGEGSASEGARLLYVALTRASHHLSLPCALWSSLAKDPRKPGPSGAFLSDDGF